MISAQEKLSGTFGPVNVASDGGVALSHDHGLALGSTVFVRNDAQLAESCLVAAGPVALCPDPHLSSGVPAIVVNADMPTDGGGAEAFRESGRLPKLPVPGPLVAANHETPQSGGALLKRKTEHNDSCSNAIDSQVIRPKVDAAPAVEGLRCHKAASDPTMLDPTATWSQPVVDPEAPPLHQVALPDQEKHPGAVNVCPKPAMSGLPGADAVHSLISAAPLMALQSEQFVALSPPCINCFEHLDALRNQVISSCDRLEILNKQGDTWADDEIRFHLLTLQQKASTSLANLKPGVAVPLMIDPLLCASWSKPWFDMRELVQNSS